MSNVKSNIRIKSNVYLRSPESCSDGDHPERDAVFVSQILAGSALKELKKRADENGVEIAFSDVQQRILNGERNIRASEINAAQPEESAEPVSESIAAEEINAAQPEESAEQASEAAAAEEITAAQPEESAGLEKIGFNELLERGFGSEKTLIVCADEGYAEYVSFLLHKNKIPHTLMNEDLAPVRHFADVLWDCNDRVIGRDSFKKRFTARCSSEAARADECFDALCGFAGSVPSDGLNIGALAEKIMSGDVPDSLFGGHDGNITVAADDLEAAGDFEKVYVLENGYDKPVSGANVKGSLSIADCPTVVCGAGRSAVIDSSGKAAVGVGRDDVDSLSFIGGSVGDAVRKQAYISQNVKCGDEVRLELNGGVYDVVHNGMVIAKTLADFSERILSEFGEKKHFDQLPQSLGGMTVTNITTVVSCRSAEEFGESVPPQFRDRNFWLGVEISGFAAEIR